MVGYWVRRLRMHYTQRPPWWRLAARRAWRRERDDILATAESAVRHEMAVMYGQETADLILRPVRP